MSTYTQIFLRKNDTFMEVSCTGNSAAISEMFSGAPWEKVRRYTGGDLHSIYLEYTDELKKWEKYLARLNERKALIPTFNNSIDEKMEQLAEYDGSIDEVNETMDELRYALARVDWLMDIANDCYNGIEVYVGKEVGENITEEDIEK